MTKANAAAETATASDETGSSKLPLLRQLSILSNDFSLLEASFVLDDEVDQEEASIPSASEPKLYYQQSTLSSFDFARLQNLRSTDQQLMKEPSPEVPVPHPEESNVYQFPEQLSPEYRPLPIPLKLLLVQMSIGIATTAAGHWLEQNLMVTVLTAFLVYVVLCALFQETLPSSRPSRVSASELKTKYHLPSPLSRYEPISKDDPTCVHWVEHHNHNDFDCTGNKQQFDLVYLNHGFGACCLDWLPMMPSLAKRLHTPFIMGHDAPGFGFTDRSNNVSDYSFQSSANTGSSLLKKQLEEIASSSGDDDDSDKANPQSILLMGHSMGAVTTLRMALRMYPNVQQRIILVAPALGLFDQVPKFPPKLPSSRPLQRLITSLMVVLKTIAAFTLRRVVGCPNFWRSGLSLAWGKPENLKDNDVLRFQWPSIGQGWEIGMVKFAQALMTASMSQDYPSDQDLLQAVLKLPNLKSVDVILGSNDNVITSSRVREFMQDFPTVRVSEMRGLGHDPFEEDTHAFVEVVERVLNKTAHGKTLPAARQSEIAIHVSAAA